VEVIKRETLGDFDESDGLGRPKAKQSKPLADTPKLRRPKVGSPAFLPEDERKSYDEIHGLREQFLRRLKSTWNEFKKKYIATFDKQVTREQRSLFNELLEDFNGIAEDSFTKGVRAGNRYYEDQFSSKGLSPVQERRVVRQHAKVFRDRSKILFRDDVSEQVNEASSIGEAALVLNGFDKFLNGYANVVGAIAYDVFARSISTLNAGLFEAFSAAGEIFPTEAVKVEWVLFDDAEHSSDCLILAEGEDRDGSGLWDAKALSETGLVPRSPNLDCGGNCRCHLSPVVPLAADAAMWLDRISIAPIIKDTLATATNTSEIGLLNLFQTKNFNIPSRIADDIVRRPSFRRKEFFNQLEGVNFQVVRGRSFAVGGKTRFAGTIRDTKVRSIDMTIRLGPGQELSTLTQSQLDEITQVFAHEVGHTFASTAPTVSKLGFGLHGQRAADDIMKIAGKERKVALQQIENNFNNVVNRMSQAQKVENGGAIVEFQRFLRNPDGFMDDLFRSVHRGETFGGIDAERAYQILNRTITEYSTGTNLVRGYQLWDRGEYFADWFSLLMVDPAKAALFNPNLNKAMASKFPSFFTKISASRAKQVIPDAVAASMRVDLPLASAFQPVAPNLESIGSAAVKFRTATSRVSNSTVQRQVAKTIRDNPSLHRQEFYRGLKVRYIDKLQTGRRTGSRKNIAFFENDQFFINYDKWRILPDEGKATIVSDVISRHVWNTAKSPVRTRMRDAYSDYLGRSIDFMANKADIQSLSRRPIENVRDVVLGNRSKGIPKNLGFWGRNFDAIRPTIEKVSDLPILNVDSLASPQAFWSEWFKSYVTHPGFANNYAPEFKDILEDFLRTSPLGKFFSFMKERV